MGAEEVVSVGERPSSGRTKLLHFPADQSLGKLHIEPDSDLHVPSHYTHHASRLDPKRVAWDPTEWGRVIQAQGDVTVPADREVHLISILRLRPEDRSRLRQSSVRMLSEYYGTDPDNLSGLARIGPNDLTRISILSPGPMKHVNERVLEPLARFTGVQILELGYTGITNQGMKYIENLRLLRSLQLREMRVSGIGLARLRDLPNLEYLDCDIGATDVDLKYLGQVSSLCWMRMRMGRIRGPGLAQLGRLPHLERLCLWGSTGLTDRHVRYLSGLTQLKSLTLWGGNFTDATLAFISKLINLEELYFIRGTTNFTALGHARLKGLKHLRILDLGLAQIEDGRYLATLPLLESVKPVALTAGNMKALSALDRLKSLGVSLMTLPRGMTEDLAAASALGHLHSLEELNFCGSAVGRYLSDHEVACLEPLENLKQLSLGAGGRRLTDRSLASFSLFRNLESLSFHGSVTGTGLNQLNKLTKLWSLSVSASNSRMTPADELALNLNALTNLRSLRLSGLSLQDDDLTFLAQLSHLQQLSVQSKSLPATTWKSLQNLSELNSLYLTGISGASEKDLAQLAGLTKLGRLNLSGRIPGAALEHLPYLPALWSLWIRNTEPMSPETQARVWESQSGHNISIHFRALDPTTLGPVPAPSQQRQPIRIRSSQPRQRTPRTLRRRR